MGGSGRGSTFGSSRTPDELRDLVRKAEDNTTVKAFENDLGRLLGELLTEYNGRDTEAVRERLDVLKEALQDELERSFDQFYGGSVAKHTYVDGMSDIDSVVLINDSGVEGQGPSEVLARMVNAIQNKLGGEATVSHGRMAVTVEYRDGMSIQLLPALDAAGNRLRVPSSRRDGWSEIDPVTFREALTRRNEECGGKLVPTIKLAKAILGQLPEPQRLSGYHVESLAIAAFRAYAGDKTTSAMLPAFFERARDLVLSPIADSTGQSVHVDGYLGGANSEERQSASHVLARLARRMRNATAAGSLDQWRAIFGLEV
jgi:hypothetical protein